MSRTRIRTTLVAGAATLALGAGMFAGLGPVASFASSHREAPLTSVDPQIDNTDVYAFVSPDAPNTVTFVSSWIPFEEPAGGPNFYDWAEHTNYDVKISNDGDAKAEITYRWKFRTHHRSPDSFIHNNGPVTSLDDENLLIYQTYDLYRIAGGKTKKLLDDAPVAPSNVGSASMPTYNADLFDAAVTDVGNSKSWVGQSDDPFFLDLRVFDLLYGGDLSEAGDDTLDGFNVNTFALQVPKGKLRGPNDGVIGIWSTASRPSMRIEHGDGTPDVLGQGRPGVSPGHAVGERGRRARGCEGLLQRLQAQGRRAVPGEGQRPRVAAPRQRGVPVRLPDDPGLGCRDRRDPA